MFAAVDGEGMPALDQARTHVQGDLFRAAIAVRNAAGADEADVHARSGGRLGELGPGGRQVAKHFNALKRLADPRPVLPDPG